MYNKISLFGAGGHGRVVARQIRTRWPGVDVRFGDMNKPCGSRINDIPVTFTTPDAVSDGHLIVTIGDNGLRARLQKNAMASGVAVGYFIADPECFFSPPPGVGSMILAGAVVNSDVVVGAGVIVNSSAIVEHDSEIGDFCHLAPGSVLAGGTVLGPRVFVGAGAQVVNQAHVAEGTVIGAGTTVISSITTPGIYAGNPARRIGSV